MSGLRDGLGEWASGHGETVGLNVAAGEATTRAAITRRRRRRVAAISGGTVAAVVAVVGIASALPNGTATPTVSIDALPITDPIRITDLECGTPWELEQGVYVHYPDAGQQVQQPEGEWIFDDGDGPWTQAANSLRAGIDDLTWSGTMEREGGLSVASAIVAVKDGVIVGSYGTPMGSEHLSLLNGVVAWSALPGECGEDYTGAADGEYTFHLIVQATAPDNRVSPRVSFVDPTGPLTVEVTGIDDWFNDAEAPFGPAALREPKGDEYQAFVVPPPDSASCTPLPDQRAAGQPGAYNVQYTVTIPGVQLVTGEAWGKAPVVVIDDPDYSAWYVGKPTALVADRVDGGNPTGQVGWTTGTTWGESDPPGTLRLINHDGVVDLPELNIPEDCAFTAQIPHVEGAVFLVIDGADAAAVDAANPGISWAQDPAAQYTWVYLGQAS